MLPAPLLPLSFAYAIFRHGLFDVQKVLLRWITYMAILVLTVAAYLAGLAWAFSHLSAIPPGWAGALIGLLALPLGWALRRLLRGIRRRFRRDFSSTREIALSAVHEPRKRFSEDSLIKSLRRALGEAFQPQLLEILPIEDRQVMLPAAEASDREERRIHFPPQPLRIPPGLLRLARENRELVLGLGSEEADWIREQGGTVRAHVDALEAQLMLLILAGDVPHSAVLLGGKYAELNYGREDRELLREVALAAGQVLETSLMHLRLVAQERLSQELETARRIQEGLVTSQVPPILGFQVALRLEPALETGGDLLFVKRRPSGSWLAAVGDVCGKGLAAALYMAQATALLEQAVQREDQGLEKILGSLDQTLRQLLGQRGFLTLILLEWDEAGHYRLARAGHPGALVLGDLSEEGTTEMIPHGRGLGVRPAGACDWEVIEGILPPRSWMVLYSDGLSEANSTGWAASAPSYGASGSREVPGPPVKPSSTTWRPLIPRTATTEHCLSLGGRPDAPLLQGALVRRSSLRWTIPTLLALQLGLLWIQGAQLHRQNQVLEGLREDIQALAESIDEGQSSTSSEEDGATLPARFQANPDPRKKVAVLGVEEEQDPAAKELQASRDSAQKAVKEAREAQSKVSFEENARKVEEARKVQAATSSWQIWIWGALALVVLALVARPVIRRRA